MNSVLFQLVSGLFAALVFAALIRPCWFRVLRANGSEEPALPKVGTFVALIATTWVLIAMQLGSGGVQEWFGGVYMLAWAGAGFGSAYLALRGAAIGATSTTTSSSSTTSSSRP